MSAVASRRVAGQLAFGFRGCLSSWIAGEVTDDQFTPAVRASLAVGWSASSVSTAGFGPSLRYATTIGVIETYGPAKNASPQSSWTAKAN